METLDYNLEVGTMNQIYEQVKNCKPIKPPYESEGNYSSDFFLDKRDGLEELSVKVGADILDDIIIDGIRYYLIKDTNKLYLGYNNSGVMTYLMSGVTCDDDSPTRIVTGRNVSGAPIQTALTVTNPIAGIGDGTFTGALEGYAEGYVKFQSNPMPDVGHYIQFTEGALKGGVNEVLHIDAGYVYIIGTNARGTIPTEGSTFNLYANTGKSIMIGHTTGVAMFILDGTNSMTKLDLLETKSPVVDLINHDGNIFALTKDNMYFGRSTFDDNTQFYPLDKFPIDEGYRLFSMGKTILTFARTNRLFAPASSTSQTLGYVGYNIDYNGNLFSKYSTIFDDQTIYILQDDNQLKEISIISTNATTYDVNTKDVMATNRGLFSSLSGGDIKMNGSDEFLNVLHYDGTDTTNYQYNKIMKHWIVNVYENKKINKFGDNVLSDGKVFTIGGDTDDGTIYSQEINMSLFGKKIMYMPYLIRTLFGLTGMVTPLDLILDIEVEIGGKTDIITKTLSNFNFDNRLNTEPTGDELLEDPTTEEAIDYNGTTVAIQNGIYKTGRFIRFKFHSENRFIIGPTYIFTEKTKPMINEYLLTN